MTTNKLMIERRDIKKKSFHFNLFKFLFKFEIKVNKYNFKLKCFHCLKTKKNIVRVKLYIIHDSVRQD